MTGENVVYCFLSCLLTIKAKAIITGRDAIPQQSMSLYQYVCIPVSFFRQVDEVVFGDCRLDGFLHRGHPCRVAVPIFIHLARHNVDPHQTHSVSMPVCNSRIYFSRSINIWSDWRGAVWVYSVSQALCMVDLRWLQYLSFVQFSEDVCFQKFQRLITYLLWQQWNHHGPSSSCGAVQLLATTVVGLATLSWRDPSNSHQELKTNCQSLLYQPTRMFCTLVNSPRRTNGFPQRIIPW